VCTETNDLLNCWASRRAGENCSIISACRNYVLAITYEIKVKCRCQIFVEELN